METKALIDKLNDSFRGSPWYGTSVMEKLDQIDSSIVNAVPVESTNSVARLVQHIINWRIFAIQKLQEDAEFDIVINSDKDWTEVVVHSEKEWDELKEKLVQTQTELIGLLQDKPPDFLSSKVPGRSYDLKFLVEGIIEHDIYHLGQIAVVAKQAQLTK